MKKMSDTKVKYKNLFNNKLNAMAYCQIIVDLKGKPIDYIFLEVNKTFEKLTGLKRKVIINRKVTDVIPNFFRSEADFINICGNVALSGKEITIEKHFEKYKEIPEKWYSFFIYSPKKGFFVSISSDITKRKKIEEEIKELNINLEKKVIERTKKYRDLVENINDAIYQFNIDGHIVYASPIIKKITGYTAKEIIGKSIINFVHPDDLAEARIKLEEDISGKPKPYETRIIKKDGSIAYVRSSGHPLIKGGKLKGIISILTDITDSKNKEKSLLESYNYLGVVNRKIAMLLDLEKVSSNMRKKDRKKLLDYISKLAINISGADTSALFKTNEDENFELLFSSGFSKEQINEIRKLSIENCKILKRIQDETTKIFGSVANNDIAALNPTKKNKHFVILPIKNYKELKGILFLGFNKEKGVDNNELEFLEIFAMHVSSAIFSAEIM